MGMTGKLQRDPRRHAPGDIGLMRHQDQRRIVGYLGQRRPEIIDADAPHRPETPHRRIGQLIAKTGQPERAAILDETPGVVFVDRNPGCFEPAPGGGHPLPVVLHGLVVPPIMIAENGVHAERRLQA